MRSKYQILLDMDLAHRQYFLYLPDHDAFIKVLGVLRNLEAELITATGDREEAYRLEQISYRSKMEEFMSRNRQKNNMGAGSVM
jgi:hypothetical protein